ncbi:MAG: hypothetical protein HZA08_04930 [Nitrospirae bacterium]|nr:hypothetical protein [Nitrospirota bacterium]
MPIHKTQHTDRREALRTRYWKAVERARAPWYRVTINRMKEFFRQEQDRIQKILIGIHTVDAFQFAIDAELERSKPLWAELFRTVYLTVGKDFGRRTAESFKGAMGPSEIKELTDAWDHEVFNWLTKESMKKITQITTTTINQVRLELSEGVAAGEGIDVIAKRIDKLYLDKIIPHRSEVIARTEVIAASNLGSRAGAKQTGLVLNHKWISTRDIRTRNFHAAADDETVPMDTPYLVGGEQLMFPGDTSHGASGRNIINCRCTEGFIPVSGSFIPPTSPQQQGNNLRQRLREVEKEIVKLKVEKAFIFNSDGTVFHQKLGDEDMVAFTPDEARKFGDKVLTHNHPLDITLSENDIFLARNTNLAEIRAVGDKYIYSMKPGPDGWKTEQEYIQAYNAAKTEFNPALEKKYEDGIITQTEYKGKLRDKIWRKVAQDVGYEYKRIPWPKKGERHLHTRRQRTMAWV